MNDIRSSFYVTTPIYYVTAQPHIGSLYSTLLADVYARWYALHGKDVFFVTGTDEHGQKVALAAEQAHLVPKEFVDGFIDTYKDTWKKYHIQYNRFIRTTDPDHMIGAQKLVQKLLDSGDIYEGVYSGWYCTPCETFITDTAITGTAVSQSSADVSSTDVLSTDVPLCTSCGRTTAYLDEKTYFFRLSAYQERLRDYYKNNSDFIVPRERAHEVISFVESGLRDLSISRSTIAWGVPFLHDPAHVIYVWVEALCNYITAIGYGNNAQQNLFNEYWPADLQVIGKDIVRFHTVYWPALLMAAGLPLPRQFLVHGWITVDKEKMSKSRGNVIDPFALAKHYDPDDVRYYLCRVMAVTHDGDFSYDDLNTRITSDLANDLGNLLNRLTTLSEKAGLTIVTLPQTWSSAAQELYNAVRRCHDLTSLQWESRMLHHALAEVWKLIHKANAFFHAQEPWKQMRNDYAAFSETIAATCHALSVIGVLLWPVMPKKMESLLASLGINYEKGAMSSYRTILKHGAQTFAIKPIAPLFIKPLLVSEEPCLEKPVVTKERVNSPVAAFDDWLTIELRVGTVVTCDRIEKSDKMLRLVVNFGPLGEKQILAGVGLYYGPEELRGRQAVFIYNLPPRKMMGYESSGMLLVTSEVGVSGRPELTCPVQLVPNGSRLQ